MFWCGFRGNPANPGWGLGWVCFGTGFGFGLPFLARVCGLCSCTRAPAAPLQSWLGCWGVFVFVCVLRLYPTTPGWGARCGSVPFGMGFSCAPLLLAGVLGCVCVFVCVLSLYPATPGWDVRCACACLGPGSAAPRHSWLVCWGVGVFVCALCLYPATPGLGVRRRCACLGSGFGCDPPLLAGSLGCVCFHVRALFPPTTPGWGVRCGCVLWFGFWLRPATPGWGFWGVCVLARAPLGPLPPLAASRGAGVCALARFLLRLATHGLEVGVCVCLCACSDCTPPPLARV